MPQPTKPTVPAAPQRSNPATFSTLADAFVAFFDPFATYLDEVGTFTDEQAGQALAAAIAGNLAGIDFSGNAGKLIGVNSSADGVQMLDAGATIYSSPTLTIDATDTYGVIIFTASCSIALSAAATLGADFGVRLIAGSGATLTITPDGSENLNGANSAITIAPNGQADIYCDGSECYATMLRAPLNDDTLASASDNDPVTEGAVKAYVDAAVQTEWVRMAASDASIQAQGVGIDSTSKGGTGVYFVNLTTPVASITGAGLIATTNAGGARTADAVFTSTTQIRVEVFSTNDTAQNNDVTVEVRRP